MSEDNSHVPESKSPEPNRNFGWFRAMRNPEAMELLARSPNAFLLAYIIAFRAQYSTTFNRFNLAPGQALLGDFRNYGMSEQEYRTAKRHLTKWHFATFKVTPEGTIARLADTRLFSVFRVEGNTQSNTRVTPQQRLPNGQLTTTKIARTKEPKNGRENRANFIPK